MKVFKKILVLVLLTSVFVGCEDDDNKFTGSPVGNLNIVTLKGEISTTAQSALSDQEIDWTVKLPRTFSDTVSVEATAISKNGRRFRAYVDVMPGSDTATGEIFAPGGSIFDTTFQLYLSGIALQTVEPGTHFLLESDQISLPTGSSGIPLQDPDKLIVRLVWPTPAAATNNLNLIVDRPTLADVTAPFNSSYGRQHLINVASTSSSNSAALSTLPGEYIFSIKATALPVSPVDLPYRVIVVFPNGDAQVFSGVYSGLTVDSPAIPVVKVNKVIGGTGQTTFEITNLIN